VFTDVILLLEEYNSKKNSHVSLKFHVNKLWEAIKLKYIYNMGTAQLNRVKITRNYAINNQLFELIFAILENTANRMDW